MNIKKSFFPPLLYAALCTIYLTFSVSADTVSLFSAQGGSLENTLIFLVFFLLFFRTSPLIFKKQGCLSFILTFLIAVFFSLFSVMGKFFEGDGNLISYMRGSFAGFVRAAFLVFSGIFLFFALIRLIGEIREWKSDRTGELLRRRIPGFLQKHPLIFMAALWTPQILLRYPGTLTIDTVNSLKQYWGTASATTQHPILYTILVGKLIDFGISIKHPAVGLYLLVLIQTILLFLVLAYTLRLLRKLSVPSWLYLTTVLFFALAPIFVSYAATAIIDTLYNVFFLLMMDELVWYLFFRRQYQKSWKHYLLTAAAIFGLHFRHNGIYVGLAVFAAGLLTEFFSLIRRRQKIRISLLFLAVLLLPALGGKYISSRLYEQYDARQLSTRAMLALPIQQVSRCMYLHGDEIDEEIIADIQRVLDWDVEDYQKVYRTYTFDKVKTGFRTGTSEDLKAFLGAWLKLVKEYPTTCIDATVNMTYFLFSPQTVNQTYYVFPKRDLELDGVDFTAINQKNSFQEKACSILSDAYNAFGYLPGFGLLINQGFTNLVLLSVTLYALVEKKGRLLYLCLPLLLTLGITFVGPMVKGHARYTYPIMYSLPLLTGIFVTYSGGKTGKKNRS